MVIHEEVTMVRRVDLIGHADEPVLWRLFDDGWLNILLSGGSLLEMPPAETRKVRAVTAHRFLPVLGDVA